MFDKKLRNPKSSCSICLKFSGLIPVNNANVLYWQNSANIYRQYFLMKTITLAFAWSIQKPKLLPYLQFVYFELSESKLTIGKF